MNKLLSKKHFLLLGIVVLTVFVGTSMITPRVSADATSSCRALYPPRSSSQGYAGCLVGYNNGKAGSQNTCYQFGHGDKYDGCIKGYNAGKADRGGNNGGGSNGGSSGGGSGGGGNSSGSGPGGVNSGASAGPDAGPDVAEIDCEKVNCTDPAADPDAACNSSGCDLIKTYVNPTIRVLSVLVALVATVSLIVGGIQYSAAGSDPQKISSAKDRISKTIIAFVAYFFLAAFLEFLVPGGIFRG